MEFILQNIYLVVLAVVSGGMLLVVSLRGAGGGGRHALNPTQATLLINRENAEVIDLREPEEYVTGHLPESRNIAAARLEERAGELDKLKDTPLILVCQNGSPSSAACAKLEKLGFAKVHSLEGGISAWRAAGLPLKKGSRK